MAFNGTTTTIYTKNIEMKIQGKMRLNLRRIIEMKKTLTRQLNRIKRKESASIKRKQVLKADN